MAFHNSPLAEKYRAKRLALMAERIRKEVMDLAERGNITWDEYAALRLNSYEQEHLYPHMTDDALCHYVERVMLPNCSQVELPAITYDKSIIANFAPLLVKRLRASIQREGE